MDALAHGLPVLVAGLVSLAPIAPQAENQAASAAAREQRWLYRETLGSGEVKPLAVFLAWDYSAVVFSVTCDRRTRELVLRSELEVGPLAPAVEPLKISSSSSTVRLHTIVVDGYLEGRTRVTKELASILRSDGDLEVFVPTEMGEPLHVGRAEPLRRLGLMCSN